MINYLYDIGDRVIVRDDLKLGEYRSLDNICFNTVTDSMFELRGQEATIVERLGGQYRVAEDDCYWVDTMFWGLSEDYSTDENVRLHGLESLI